MSAAGGRAGGALDAPHRRARRRRAPVGLVFILPSALVIAVVVVWPIIATTYLGFTDYSMFGAPEWTGLDNLTRLVQDPDVRRAVWITVLYTVISVPLQTVLAMLLADILARRFRNRLGSWARSILFIPVMASLVLTGTVWRYLLAYDGPVNQVLGWFGVPQTDWLGDSSWVVVVIALVTAWKNIGYFLVIYYAGIMDVPGDVYEAAALDGAGPWHLFWRITLPILRPVTLLVVILGTIWSFQVFDLVYTMTNGGPGGASTTLVYLIYQAAFKSFKMGYASALSVVLFLAILVISIVQRRALREG
ncbi:MAG TPA: sugar ABC transporter permease [Cellulomonas sp.]